MAKDVGCIIESRRGWSPNEYQEALMAQLKSDDFKVEINQILLDEAKDRRYIPIGEGSLMRDGKAQKNGIRYTLPYARYQYWGEVYGDNWMCYIWQNHEPVDKMGWRSPPGKGSKHPTGRRIGSVKATFFDNYGFEWELGYNNDNSKPEWIRYAYENNKRSIGQKITAMLKRKLKAQ